MILIVINKVVAFIKNIYNERIFKQQWIKKIINRWDLKKHIFLPVVLVVFRQSFHTNWWRRLWLWLSWRHWRKLRILVKVKGKQKQLKVRVSKLREIKNQFSLWHGWKWLLNIEQEKAQKYQEFHYEEWPDPKSTRFKDGQVWRIDEYFT